MMEFTIKQVTELTGGTYWGDPALLNTRVSGVSLDTRKLHPGALFIPIVGDRLDGHNFLPTAFEKGAVAALSERKVEGVDSLILVDSTQAACQALAAAYRRLFPIPFVGITGSVGKTTTKEMIYSVLSQERNTLKNEGNLNNQTGVPLTLFRLEPSYQAAVVEMGTNHFGEISRLSKMVRPDIAVLTNIGDAHIEYLGSREGILQAKCEMFEFMNPEGQIILNGDDYLIRTLLGRSKNITTYGMCPENDVYASDVEDLGLMGSRFTAHLKDRMLRVTMRAPGRHMILNALCAIAVGEKLDISDRAIERGISAYESADGRMHVIKTGRLTLLNDAYNANPTSMKASIDVAVTTPGRCVLVLGDMHELGPNTLAYHAEVGRYAVRRGADLVITVGLLSEATHEAVLSAGGKGVHFEDNEALVRTIASLLREGDTVLFKGSHGMHLGEVVEHLKNF